MKLIKHIIPIDIGSDRVLIINSLNGVMDKVDASVFNIIRKWQEKSEISPESETEYLLFNNLNTRGYLVKEEEEELAKKEEVINKLRNKNKKAREASRHLTFIMTYDCNFRCPYCFEGSNNKRKEVITPEYIDAALKLSKNLESVGLFGGEPLLPRTRASLEYLVSKTKGLKYNITTNGYYLEEFYDFLSPLNLTHITVTLDGDANTHNARRSLTNGNPTYQKIMAGIKRYLSSGVHIRIRMNLDESNIFEASNLREQLLIEFDKYRENLSFEVSPMLEASSDERYSIKKRLFDSEKKYATQEREAINVMHGRYNPIINAISVGARVRPLYYFCQAHSNSFIVDPYGIIFPCLPSVGKNALSVGCYYPQVKFKENSIYFRNIEKIEKCRSCIYSLLCGGGCPLRLSSYENFFQPECFSFHEQLNKYLPMYFNANGND